MLILNCEQIAIDHPAFNADKLVTLCCPRRWCGD